MILGIDCDSVLFPFSENFVPFAEKMLNRKLPYPDKFHMHEQWGISSESWRKIFEEFVAHNELLIHKPYDGVKETLDILKSKGHDILIATHRVFPDFPKILREKMVTDTIEWLEGNNLYFDDLLFLKHKWLVNFDILFDDAIHNLEKVHENTIPVAIEQPWNKEWNGYKISKFSDCIELVDLIASQK